MKINRIEKAYLLFGENMKFLEGNRTKRMHIYIDGKANEKVREGCEKLGLSISEYVLYTALTFDASCIAKKLNITLGKVNKILKNADIIRRIYNWIDLEVFRPQNTDELRKELGILPSEKVLLGVASVWCERKGLTEMQLAAKIPNTKVILVGDVPDGMEQPSNMICVGKIKSAEKLAQYYAMADVFLNPSVQETFGKTTAEALSCGTPVVVYNTTACPELVGEYCGIVVPLKNSAAYVEAVQVLIQEDANDHANICRQHALNMFSTDECFAQYYSVMKDVVAQ